MIECFVRSSYDDENKAHIVFQNESEILGRIDISLEDKVSNLLYSLMRRQKKVIFCCESHEFESSLPYYNFDLKEKKLSIYPSGQFLLRDIKLFLESSDTGLKLAINKMKQGQQK